MTPRGWIALILAGLVLVPGCTQSTEPGSEVVVETSFEDGLKGWTKNSDVPEDPNEPGAKVDWRIVPSRNHSHTGEWGVEFFLDGRQDDGTIWITQPVRIEAQQAYRANVSVWAWSPSESFNTTAHLVMHLGFKAPNSEGDFPAPGENTTADGNASAGGLREPLNQKEGFKRYSFGWTVPASEARTVYMAVGISAVWETEMTYSIDDLRIELTRIPASEAGPSR